MSSLKVRQIKAKMLKLFEPHLDLSDIGTNDQQREVKLLSRCLAAYAIYREIGCTAEEAASAVWDGSDDNGIDAAYVDTADQRVVFAQAKWMQAGSGEPEAKDLRTFADGVKDVIEQDDGSFGERLMGKLSAIHEATLEVGTTLKMVVITTGKSDLAVHGTSVMNKLVGYLNGDDTGDSASWEVMGLDEIYSGLGSGPINGLAVMAAG